MAAMLISQTNAVRVELRPSHKYHVKSPKYLSGNSQKNVLNIIKLFPNISKNPLKISLIFVNKTAPILNHLGQNIFAVRGVEEENSGGSTLPAFAILENCCFSAFSDVDYIFRVCNR